MSERTPEQVDKIVRLTNAILAAINDFAETEVVTTGEGMEALFEALVVAAKASPNYAPKRLIADMDVKIREAVGLQ